MADSRSDLRSLAALASHVTHAQAALVAVVRDVLAEAVRGGTDLPEGFAERVSATVGLRARKTLLALASHAFDAGTAPGDAPP